MTKEYAPEEIIIVTIGDREFKTALDENDTQRFLPHNEGNPELAALMVGWNEWLNSSEATTGRVPNGLYTPNDMILDAARGRWTVDELLSYQTATGYSVAGLADLSTYEEMPISNPLWAGDDE